MAQPANVIRPAGDTSILDYPDDQLYLNWGLIGTIGFHLMILAIIALLAYLNHLRNLQDAMTAAIPEIPPDQMQIILIDENKPPPPTDHPEWIKQIIIPKDKPPPPPPPKPKPKPKPKPQIIHAVPRPMPKPPLGSTQLPVPNYPAQAYAEHISGTVLIRVSFDGVGGVISAEVVGTPSGSTILDSETHNFILRNWHAPNMAGQVQVYPIRYEFPH